MAKKKRVRYTKEQDFKIRARVDAAKKQNRTWPQIHAIAKEAGYQGGVDSLKQRYGSKSHRVGNTKVLGVHLVGNGRKAFIAAINKLVDQQVAQEVNDFKAKFKAMLK